MTLANRFRKCGLLPWDPAAVKVPIEKFEVDENENGIDINEKKDTIISSTNTKSDLQIFFSYLEKEIGPEKLEMFRKNMDKWDGPLEDSTLYNLWKKNYKKLSFTDMNNLSDNQQSPTVDISEEDDVLATPLDDVIADISVSDSVLQRTVSENGVSIEKSGQQAAELKSLEKGAPENSADIESNSQEDTEPEKGKNQEKSASTKGNIPSPFKKSLFWPGPSNNDNKKRRSKEKLPAVASSAQMLQYFQKKEDEKKRIEQEKEDRKRKREEKKREAEVLKNMKKMKLSKKAPRKETSETSSESEELPSDKSDDECDGEWYESSEDEEEAEQVPNKKALQKNDLVLVQCTKGKRNAVKSTSLCIISNLSRKIEVMQLKNVDNGKKKFLLDPDESVITVTLSQILGKIKNPISVNENTYIFEKKVPIFF